MRSQSRSLRAPALLGAFAVVSLLGGCSRGGGSSPIAVAPPTSTTSTGAPVTVAPGDGEASTKTDADLFAGATTAPPSPSAAFSIRLSGVFSGQADGAAATQCLTGDGYFDVVVAPEPPLGAGAWSVSGLTFGAPKFRGPGTYRAADAKDAEWSVELVDPTSGGQLSFYSPMAGASGTIVVGDDGRSGRFDIGGLVNGEGDALAVSGRFTCGSVEK